MTGGAFLELDLAGSKVLRAIIEAISGIPVQAFITSLVPFSNTFSFKRTDIPVCTAFDFGQ